MLNINRSKQCDKMSPIQNYVWSFRYTGEIPRSDLVDMVTEAMTQEQSKMTVCLTSLVTTNQDL